MFFNKYRLLALNSNLICYRSLSFRSVATPVVKVPGFEDRAGRYLLWSAGLFEDGSIAYIFLFAINSV